MATAEQLRKQYEAYNAMYEVLKKVRDYLAISRLPDEIKLVAQIDQALAKAEGK